MYALILATLLLFVGTSAPTVSDAKALTLGHNYDESIAILLKINPSKQDYNEYCFLMATNYFALNDKVNAEKWLKNLNGSFDPMPTRYQALAYMMEEDLKHWKADDLPDITRDMKISGDRLDTARAGEQTQKVQKQIVDKLDKLIKEQEQQANGKGKGDGKDKDGQAQKPQPGDPMGNQSTKPADDSKVMGGSGAGKVDEKKMRAYAESWGTLPPQRRAEIVQEISRDLPPKYKPMIDEYFKSLNRMHPNK